MGQPRGHVRSALAAIVAAASLAAAATAAGPAAVAGTPNGVAGAGGWYRGVTQIVWNVTPDPGFALLPPLPAPTAVGEGAGVTYASGQACESDGALITLCDAGSLTLSVDNTPPLLGP